MTVEIAKAFETEAAQTTYKTNYDTDMMLVNTANFYSYLNTDSV